MNLSKQVTLTHSEGAFEFVQINKLIKRFLVNYGLSRKAFKVIEFHQDGYPHWHIVVDLADAESFAGGWDKVNLKAMNRLWSSYFGVRAQLDLPLRANYSTPEKCFGYAIKYCTKSGGRLPVWAIRPVADQIINR